MLVFVAVFSKIQAAHCFTIDLFVYTSSSIKQRTEVRNNAIFNARSYSIYINIRRMRTQYEPGSNTSLVTRLHSMLPSNCIHCRPVALHSHSYILLISQEIFFFPLCRLFVRHRTPIICCYSSGKITCAHSRLIVKNYYKALFQSKFGNGKRWLRG